MKKINSIAKIFFLLHLLVHLQVVTTLAVGFNCNEVTTSSIYDQASGTDSISNEILTVTRGPYLQMLQTTGITIRWRTNIATNSRVEYGTGLNYEFITEDTTITTEHIVTLNNLLPNTKYFYRIGSITQVIQGDQNNFFTTAVPTGTVAPLRIWVTGDFGNGSTSQAAVRDAYAVYSADLPANLWIWLGDNAYSRGRDSEFQSYVFDMYPHQLKNIPVYPSLGNHDYGNLGYQSAKAMSTSSAYFDIFTIPEKGEAGGVASGSEKYYSYDNGNVHFIVLDTYGSYSDTGSDMYNWLQNDLTLNTQRWTIVYFHHPPYTKGSHDSDYDVASIEVRKNILPLLEYWHVDLVLSGHSHNNERSYLIHNHFGSANTFTSQMKVSTDTITITKFHPYEGAIYAVCGTSGQDPGTTQSGWPMPCMYFTNHTYNCSMIIDVDGDELNAKFLTASGTIADQFTIIKAHPDSTKTNSTFPFEIFSDSANPELSKLSFNLEQNEIVELKVYNTFGKIISYPVRNLKLDAGYHEIKMEGIVTPGTYLVKLSVGNSVSTRRIIRE